MLYSILVTTICVWLKRVAGRFDSPIKEGGPRTPKEVFFFQKKTQLSFSSVYVCANSVFSPETNAQTKILDVSIRIFEKRLRIHEVASILVKGGENILVQNCCILELAPFVIAVQCYPY